MPHMFVLDKAFLCASLYLNYAILPFAAQCNDPSAEQVALFVSKFKEYRPLQSSLHSFIHTKKQFLYKIDKQTLMVLQNDAEVQKLLNKLDVGGEFLLLFQEKWMAILTGKQAKYTEEIVDNFLDLDGIGDNLWPEINANAALCFQSNRKIIRVILYQLFNEVQYAINDYHELARRGFNAELEWMDIDKQNDRAGPSLTEKQNEE